MLHDNVHRHKAKGHMSLEQIEELRAVEYQAAASLVWIVDAGASYDVVPEGLAQVYGWKKVPLAEPIKISTANGPAESRGAVLTRIPGMS